uniref:Uncharacterized protein n=1 Tax=Timema shepardi TaxID=629360 RepID=A0A7R9FVA1_TIMSH|nr:unnamed protein product [Timema shepardi]
MRSQKRDQQKKFADTTLEDACNELGAAPKVRLSTKKMLKGHINKVNSVHFSGDNRHCVSGSLDGKLIIWDTWTGNKVQVIPLRSAWVMSVAFAQSGNYVACGGMDNMCTVYDLNNRDSTGSAKITRELLGYEGFLSSCRFIDDKTLITGSGDMKVCMWDLEANKKTMEFDAHAGDVVSISLSPDGQRYVTGSVDRTCKLWDLRDPNCKQTFFGHDADVNSVCLANVLVVLSSTAEDEEIEYHPSGYSFVTGSEDKTARLYDLRSDQQVALYSPPNNTSGFTSCGLSLSGRYILCGSDDKSIHIWDTLKNLHNGCLTGHDNRVTSLSVAENGMAMASCSWDQYVRIWV